MYQTRSVNFYRKRYYCWRKRGGGITWFQEDIALEFYLNPEMARPFGKLPAEWRRLPKTNSLIASAKKAATGKSLSIDNLIFTECGSTKSKIGGGATWMHKEVIPDFTRKLALESAYIKSDV